jgi:hypothetical protein
MNVKMKARAVIMELILIDQSVHDSPDADNISREKWLETDSFTSRELNKVIKIIGWPTISKVGKEASDAASLIARHADHDVAFQKECLRIMSRCERYDVPEIEIAYLHDRICVNEKRPQFFGTQFTTDVYGAYGPQPIELPEFVDERRAEVGSVSLAEYKAELMKKYSMVE